MKKQCHQPGRDSSHHYNNNGVGQSFQTGTHIQLGKVDSACDKRKARNDKQHGTDVPGFMLDGNVEQKLCQLQEACIYKTGGGNRNCNAHKQSKMMLAKLAADGVSDACACKSQDHFQRATAQKKSKCTTGQCRSQSQGGRGIKPVDPLDLI